MAVMDGDGDDVAVGVLDGVGVLDEVGVGVGVPGTAVSDTSSICGERVSSVVLNVKRYCTKRPGGLVTAKLKALLAALQADQVA